MTNRQQTWFAIVVICGPFLWAYVSKKNREIETKERLEACFRADPRSAARFYSRKTPDEVKVAIFEACIPDAGGADEDRDAGRYGR
jgi:hypothetical protein